MVLTGYFDEGGGKDQGFTVVCGWISDVERWDGFDADWKLFLIKYDVPYLHMKEYSQSTGPFAKWKGQKLIRAKFLSDAAEIIGSRVRMGFIFYVKTSAYATVNSLFRLSDFFGSPYALAGRMCVDLSMDWGKKTGNGQDMKFIFDDGNTEKTSLVNSMTSVLPHFPTPSFEASRNYSPSRQWPLGRKGLVRLQAADFLAYECRKAMKERMIKGRFEIPRRSLGAVLRAPYRMAGLPEIPLVRLCRAHNIPERLPASSDIYGELPK